MLWETNKTINSGTLLFVTSLRTVIAGWHGVIAVKMVSSSYPKNRELKSQITDSGRQGEE